MPKNILPLINTPELQTRVAELGRYISKDYPSETPLVLIGVLRGALYFLSDLSRAITRPIEIDMISVSSYTGTQSTGKITLLQDITADICNKDVILVEDIIDTGLTLSALIEHFKKYNPKSIKTCVCLDKPSRRQVSTPVHYRGFRIADHFVVGYGLDYEQAYRNLPYVGIYAST